MRAAMLPVIALIIGLAGSTARPALAQTEITIGLAPTVVTASTYLAIEKGYLRDAGFTLKIENLVSGAKLIPYLATGGIEVLQAGISAADYNAIAQGLPITMALDAGSSPINQDLLVRPDLKDKIRTIGDLKGRSIAIVAPGSIPAYVVGKTLETAGLSLSDVDVKYVPFPMMGEAFANGAIDAALEVPPFGDILVSKGLAARWIDPDKIVKPTPMEVVAYMVNTEWAARNSAAAHRLMTAFARAGRDYCQAYHHGPGRDEVAQTLVAHKVVTNAGTVEKMAWQARDPNGRFNLASLIDEQDWFFTHHFIQGRAAPGRLVDTSYAEAAAKTLGPFEVVNKDDQLAGCR